MSTDTVSDHLRQMSDERLRELRLHIADQVTAYRLRIDVDGPCRHVEDNLSAYQDLLSQVDGEYARRRAVPQANGDDGSLLLVAPS